MTVKQLSIFIENRPGRLAELTKILAEHTVDIRALSLADTTDYGILRLIVSKPEEACAVMRAEGFRVSLKEVLAAAMEDRPGGLHRAIASLHEAGVVVEYTYAFVTREQGRACVILRVDDNERAEAALQNAGVPVLGPSEIYGL